MIQRMLAISFLVPLPFLKPAWTSGSLQFMYCWSLAWRISSITLLWLWSYDFGHSKHPLPTTQEKTLHVDITRWSTPKSDWLYSLQPKMEKLYTDCGSDHELLLAKFRVKLKKVGKITRPFRYDLNQTPYDYTVEVRNRFKRLDLIDKSAWWTMDGGSWHCTGDRD